MGERERKLQSAAGWLLAGWAVGFIVLVAAAAVALGVWALS